MHSEEAERGFHTRQLVATSRAVQCLGANCLGTKGSGTVNAGKGTDGVNQLLRALP